MSARDSKTPNKTSKSDETGMEAPLPPTTQRPSPPPNGGMFAWLQCLNTFLLWFVVWGLVNSFGVFQAYYSAAYLPKVSSSRISWIGSLQLCIFILGSVAVGPLYDMGFLRSLLALGTGLIVVGLMMTSLATTYPEIILAQGLCMGLGMTCNFIPCVSVLPPYFSSRRAVAMGFAATGSSIGGDFRSPTQNTWLTALGAIVLTFTFQQLVPQVGFGWATRTMAFVLLACLILPVATMCKRVPQAQRRAFTDMTALKEPAFNLTLCAMFVVFAGLYVPYFYIEVFSIRRNIFSAGPDLTKNLVVIMNVGSLFGRLLPNILADWLGPWNTVVPVCVFTAIVGYSWLAVAKGAGMIAFCIFYGFFSGSFVALVPLLWASLSPDPKVLGTRIGMMTVPMAMGLLIGNPIAGALVHSTSFVGLQVFCASTAAGGSLLLFFGRAAKHKGETGWKV